MPARALTGPAQASYGPHTGIFNVFTSHGTPTGPVRDPQGCRTAPLQARKGIDTTTIDKNPTRASHLAVQAPYGPRMGCSRAVYIIKTRTGPISL